MGQILWTQEAGFVLAMILLIRQAVMFVIKVLFLLSSNYHPGYFAWEQRGEKIKREDGL